MRYYNIVISNADGSPYRTYTSFPNGKTDLGALDIEIDVSVTAFDAPINNPYVRIYGVSLQDIGQANDLNGKFITMSAGMQKGLPLANPAQAGQIFSGSIYFAFGNWQGTSQSLDLILNAVQPTPKSKAPNNIVWNWQAKTPMAQALATTFSGAFPTMKQSINISSKLVMPTNEFGFYENLGQFATYIRELSLHILGGTENYVGVSISASNGTIIVFDGTQLTQQSASSPSPVFIFKGVSYPITNGSITVPGSVFQDPNFTGFEGATSNPNGTFTVSGVQPNGPVSSQPMSLNPNSSSSNTAIPKQLSFTDLMGQPTWMGPFELSTVLVMRGDLKVGSFVKMPTGLPNLGAVTTAASLPQFRQKSVFQGTFFLHSLRHVGRFRQPDGSSWCTVANLFLQSPTQ